MRAEIGDIKKEMEGEEIDTTDLRTPDEIKTEYDKKIDAIKNQREDVKKKIEKHK